MVACGERLGRACVRAKGVTGWLVFEQFFPPEE